MFCSFSIEETSSSLLGLIGSEKSLKDLRTESTSSRDLGPKPLISSKDSFFEANSPNVFIPCSTMIFSVLDAKPS